MSPNKAHVPYTHGPLSPHIPVPTLSHSYRDKGDVKVGDQGQLKQSGTDSPAKQSQQSSQPVDNLWIVSKPRSLGEVIAPDPEVTAWVAAVRARFPGARPLWGTSSVGSVGREP